MTTKKILLDTDIGSDIDDAVCLAYLLAQPQAELVGITTVSGEPVKRAQMASAQCKVAGKQVPIYAGVGAPLLVETFQPRAPQAEALDRWEHDTDFPTGEAIEFMRRTIRAHPGEITLLAIGQLTNVALLFASDPEIPAMLKELVMMSGYFMAEDRYPEWNVKLDPHAAEIVYRAHPPVIRAIGLDVTLQVTMPADEVRQRFDTPLLRPVLDFAEVWFRQVPEITFHDPLAATTLFDDQICGFERGRVEIELTPGDASGRTSWHPDAAGPHEIATIVDAARFFEHFFSMQ